MSLAAISILAEDRFWRSFSIDARVFSSFCAVILVCGIASAYAAAIPTSVDQEVVDALVKWRADGRMSLSILAVIGMLVIFPATLVARGTIPNAAGLSFVSILLSSIASYFIVISLQTIAGLRKKFALHKGELRVRKRSSQEKKVR